MYDPKGIIIEHFKDIKYRWIYASKAYEEEEKINKFYNSIEALEPSLRTNNPQNLNEEEISKQDKQERMSLEERKFALKIKEKQEAIEENVKEQKFDMTLKKKEEEEVKKCKRRKI